MEKIRLRRSGTLARVLLLLCLVLQGAVLCAQTINGNFPAENLTERIERIKKQTGKNIVYRVDQTANVNVKALDANGLSVEEALSRSLSGTGFTVDRSGQALAVHRAAAANPSTQQAAKTGSISGTVLDSDGFPLPGATVRIAEDAKKGAATGIKGEFTLDGLAAGRSYTVTVSCISFATMTISDVKVTAGKATPLDIILQEASEQLGEVVITATYNKASANGLYAKQKNMVAMSDGVSSDLIKKTPDNNVAQVLKRVSGVTIENGKYVTVRGLSERYNNVQLNGSSLPSTEPNRRNFSFDIIPTSLIDNVTIAKTFTPDLPGEFTGGLVEVNTLSIPQEKVISLNVGTGFNTISTGKDFHSNQRYGSDYLFGNSREWYGTLWNSDVSNGIFEGGKTYLDLTDSEKKVLNEMDAKVPNRWGLRKYKGAPTQNYAMTVGLPFDLGNSNKLGVIASLSYRHEENTEDLQKAYFISNGDTLVRGNQYKFITSVGAVANVGYERPGHTITWRNLFNNRFTHTNMERVIWVDGELNPFKYEQFSSPQINRLWQTQLSGSHKLPYEMLFTWNADYSKVNRITPDDRFARGEIPAGTKQEDILTKPYEDYIVQWVFPYWHDLPKGFMMYSKLVESKKNIGANLEYPFIVEGLKQKVKAGYMGTFRNADFRREYVQTRTITSSSVIPDTPEQLGLVGATLPEMFDPQRYADGLQYLRTASKIMNNDYYIGKQSIHAAYLMGDFTFWKRLHLTGGFRMEAGRMEVTSAYRNLARQETIDTTMVSTKTDWLPAVTAIYNITDNLNFRAAYSKTLARPDFREMSFCEYFNVEDRIQVVNLGAVRQSYIDNVDLRLEWYPQPGEVISLSGFYKKFKDPVEMISFKNGNDGKGYTMYTFNLDEATALGLELNVRKSLGFLAPGSFLKDMYLSGNATILKGDVTYNIYELIDQALNLHHDSYPLEKRERPLQGLAPYTVNAGLSYNGKIFGAAINYGTAGRKLMQAGQYVKYDEYEAPRHVLDLQVSARFLKGQLEVKANAGDILNNVYRVYRNCAQDVAPGEDDDRTSLGLNYDKGDWIVSQYKRGTTFSLSASYKF